MTQWLATRLAPEARFVVSYVTKKGEVVADSLVLNVVDYMANKVRSNGLRNVGSKVNSSLNLLE